MVEWVSNSSVTYAPSIARSRSWRPGGSGRDRSDSRYRSVPVRCARVIPPALLSHVSAEDLAGRRR